MRVQIDSNRVALWLSAADTANWARHWPCSTLRLKRLFAEFDSNGLCDLTINGRDGDCDGVEFNAIISDFLAGKLPPGHPCEVFFEPPM
jgi:hypothetical protein